MVAGLSVFLAIIRGAKQDCGSASALMTGSVLFRRRLTSDQAAKFRAIDGSGSWSATIQCLAGFLQLGSFGSLSSQLQGMVVCLSGETRFGGRIYRWRTTHRIKSTVNLFSQLHFSIRSNRFVFTVWLTQKYNKVRVLQDAKEKRFLAMRTPAFPDAFYSMIKFAWL